MDYQRRVFLLTEDRPGQRAAVNKRVEPEVPSSTATSQALPSATEFPTTARMWYWSTTKSRLPLLPIVSANVALQCLLQFTSRVTCYCLQLQCCTYHGHDMYLVMQSATSTKATYLTDYTRLPHQSTIHFHIAATPAYIANKQDSRRLRPL